jgi:hypothetical protein
MSGGAVESRPRIQIDCSTPPSVAVVIRAMLRGMRWPDLSVNARVHGAHPLSTISESAAIARVVADVW